MIVNKIFCFHGFWGEPTDFDFLKNTIPNLESIDLKIHSGKSFKQWTEFFQKEYFDQEEVSFIGYSQGGRMVLEGLRNLSLENQKKINKIILLSTGVVFPDRAESERVARQENDLKWVEKFKKDSTETLWLDWNSQEVFANSKIISKKENLTDSDREFLSTCLKAWSQAEQQDTFSILKRLASKTKLIVGDGDQKYLGLIQRLIKEIPDLSHSVIKTAGHRILIDQPEELASLIHSVLAVSN